MPGLAACNVTSEKLKKEMFTMQKEEVRILIFQSINTRKDN